MPELNDMQMYNEKFKIHQFNILASDRIALNRSLKDNRFDEYENDDFIKVINYIFQMHSKKIFIRTANSNGDYCVS